MPPVRKSRSVNKRFTNEASPGKFVRKKHKKTKKKLSDKLGPQWSRKELERFYDAYRKHGQEWKKVAAAIRKGRSVDMVEALFNMNRAYLSLPEGTASVAGLIAMMTDHYSVMEESGTEGEDHEASEAPRKYKKRKREKPQLSDSKEEVDIQHSVESADGCLTYLKQARATASQIRVTGKRTPRVPIKRRDDDREGCSTPPPSKRARKQLDGNDDVAHFLALALTDASRRGEVSDSSPPIKKTLRARKIQSKYRNSSIYLTDMEGVGEMEVNRKGKKMYKKKLKVEQGNDDSDDNGEASSATEGLRIKSKKQKALKGKTDMKLTSGDDFDALQALAELSALMDPTALVESESSDQLKEERMENDIDEKSSTPENASTSSHGEKANTEPKPSNQSLRKKRKPKKLGDESPTHSSLNKKALHESAQEDDNNIKSSVKTKRAGQVPFQSKQMKTLSMDERRHIKEVVVMPSTKQDSVSAVPESLSPKQPPNRRKLGLKKSLLERVKTSETKASRSSRSLSEHEFLLKVKLSATLSYPLARRRCIYEWFYSGIDHPWFAKMEFVDYLNHVGLGHIPRLTRLEWSVIKSSLGRPRRFSERFIQEEREKLRQYRESVRKHYTELRTGAREGLPTDLAKPLAVGNRVIAIHPKTRELHDGKILTVDHDKCNVLFDELGVELVMDIDLMPLSPFEYMPESLRRRVDKSVSIKKEPQMISGNTNLNVAASVIFPPCVLETIDFSVTTSSPQETTNQLYVTTHGNVREAETQRASPFVKHHVLDDKEIEPEMMEIVKGSNTKAHAMVDAAMKAASSVKEGEDVSKLIQEALDLIGQHQPLQRSTIKHEHSNGGSIGNHHHNSSPSDTTEPIASEKNESQMPSELITSCVASWLMLQMCTERQHPPGDVAQLIDEAVTRLQPRCPQNMSIYREIQMCMGRIKTQILALVPT